MSASGPDSINLANTEGDTTGTSVLNGTIGFLAAGGDAVTLLMSAIIGAVLSPFVALSNIINAIGTFFSDPLRSTGQAIGALASGFFEAPGDLLASAEDVTSAALPQFGVAAFPIAIGIVLLSMFIVVQYLQEPETGELVPGIPIDVPDVFGLVLGVEEENPDEDEENIG